MVLGSDGELHIMDPARGEIVDSIAVITSGVLPVVPNEIEGTLG